MQKFFSNSIARSQLHALFWLSEISLTSSFRQLWGSSAKKSSEMYHFCVSMVSLFIVCFTTLIYRSTDDNELARANLCFSIKSANQKKINFLFLIQFTLFCLYAPSVLPHYPFSGRSIIIDEGPDMKRLQFPSIAIVGSADERRRTRKKRNNKKSGLESSEVWG